MRPMHALATPLLCLFAMPAFAQATGTPTPEPRHSASECAVWARELSFARSVEQHDAAAFARHLHAQAAFGSSRTVPNRGRETITRSWSGIIEGKAVRLRWYPSRVTMAPGVPDVAWSSGPSLFEDLDPKARRPPSLGAFHSVWHKGADGVWRVLFDDGVEGQPATPEQVAAFEAGRREACPGAIVPASAAAPVPGA